jgi:hypothetical protein
MKTQDIAEKTGWIVKELLEHCFNPEIGNPWKTDSNRISITVTKDEVRKLTKTFKNITESDFNDIFEGLENSLFATNHCAGKKDTYQISFIGLPGLKRLK